MAKPRAKKSTGRILAVILAILGAGILIILACLISPFVLNTLVNNQKLNSMKDQLSQVGQFPGATLISKGKIVGTLMGSGDHCDFFAGELWQSTADPAQISAFYAGTYVEVLFIQNGKIPVEDAYWPIPYQFDTLAEWGVDPADIQNHFYMIYSSYFEADPGLDIRCY